VLSATSIKRRAKIARSFAGPPRASRMLTPSNPTCSRERRSPEGDALFGRESPDMGVSDCMNCHGLRENFACNRSQSRHFYRLTSRIIPGGQPPLATQRQSDASGSRRKNACKQQRSGEGHGSFHVISRSRTSATSLHSRRHNVYLLFCTSDIHSINFLLIRPAAP